jgi:hypothetical protein
VTSATFKYDRIPFLVRFEEDSLVKETYAGRLNTVALEGQLLKPHGSASDTVLVFMHPSGTMNYLPFPIAMAQAGHHVMCCGSRYPHNDSALIMEKVIADLGAYVRQARDRFGYGKVVLAGWSGGGSLSLFYQAQAERPTITAGLPRRQRGAGAGRRQVDGSGGDRAGRRTEALQRVAPLSLQHLAKDADLDPQGAGKRWLGDPHRVPDHSPASTTN